MSSVPEAESSATPTSTLAAIRTEIDALDDAMHELLRRRAAVVARMAQSRAKAGMSNLRPGREAQVLRRLLGQHDGALPARAVVRLWRDIFAACTQLQGSFTIAVHGAPGSPTEHLAREHFGALTPLRLRPSPASALALVASGEAVAAVLALPRDEEPPEALWWTNLDSPRLQIGARLPFLAAPGSEATAEALVVGPGAPDPSGEDRSLLRLESRSADQGRAQLAAALTAAGLPPRQLIFRRSATGAAALAEVEGAVIDGDPRLSALPVERALPLGFYAVPLRRD
jgi:chorismate mutase/prephenate dehydratase